MMSLKVAFLVKLKYLTEPFILSRTDAPNYNGRKRMRWMIQTTASQSRLLYHGLQSSFYQMRSAKIYLAVKWSLYTSISITLF